MAKRTAKESIQTAATFKAAAQSAATTKSYAQAVRHFKAHGGRIPSSAVELSAYIARFAGSLSVATLEHRLVAIHRAHTDQGLSSPAMEPEVKRTMQGIRRTYGTAQRRVKAIVKDDLLELLVLVERQRPLKAARDKALLLVGFAGAFRRSELVGIRYEDLTRCAQGMEVLLRRSKTDQEGKGRTVFIPFAKGDRCPIKAVQAWLEASGIKTGYLFRGVTRHDKLAGERPLTPQSVALLVKQATMRVRGADAARDVAAHSLRAGYVTEAASVGLLPYQIRSVTGHRSDSVLATYVRPLSIRKIPSLL